jgi:hypothetical protein
MAELIGRRPRGTKSVARRPAHHDGRVGSLSALQRSVGNQAVARLLQRSAGEDEEEASTESGGGVTATLPSSGGSVETALPAFSERMKMFGGGGQATGSVARGIAKLDDSALAKRKDDLESELEAVAAEMSNRNSQRISQFGSDPAYADRLRELGGVDKSVFDEVTGTHFFNSRTRREKAEFESGQRVGSKRQQEEGDQQDDS